VWFSKNQRQPRNELIYAATVTLNAKRFLNPTGMQESMVLYAQCHKRTLVRVIAFVVVSCLSDLFFLGNENGILKVLRKLWKRIDWPPLLKVKVCQLMNSSGPKTGLLGEHKRIVQVQENVFKDVSQSVCAFL
jgi:hypothetical protein